MPPNSVNSASLVGSTVRPPSEAGDPTQFVWYTSALGDGGHLLMTARERHRSRPRLSVRRRP